jgi:tetratricopeptide (TPR) repeat protein
MAPEHHFDCLGIILTIFKFLGIFVSGAGAIVSTTSTKPSKKASKPESQLRLVRMIKKIFSKQWALRWVVIGLFVSFFSQFLETMKLADEAKETVAKDRAVQLDTSHQLSLARSSVDKLESQSRLMQKQMLYIEHMLGEFDTLSVTFECELFSTNPAVNILLHRMQDLAPFSSATPSFSCLLFDDFPDNKTKPTRSQIVSAVTQQKRYSDNVIGHVNVSDTLPSFWPNNLGILVDIDDVCSSNWLNSLSTNIDFVRLVSCIRSPHLAIRLYSRQTTNLALSDADLYSASSILRQTPSMAYNPISENIFLKWTFDYTNSEWQQTDRMGSTHDLDNAILYLNFDSIPKDIVIGLVPHTAKLDIGKTTILVQKTNWVKEIKYLNTSNQITVFKATLPPHYYLPTEGEDISTLTNQTVFPVPLGFRVIADESNVAISDSNIYTYSGISESVIFFNRGVMQYDRKDFAGAITNIKKSIELDSSNAMTYYYCAGAMFYLNDYTGAIANLDKVIELNPKMAEAYFNRGNSKLNLDDYKGAIDDYDEGIELNPNYAWAYDGRGTAMFYLKDYTGAITNFNKVIELEPTDAEAYFNRGNSKHHLGDCKGAIGDFDKAIELNPYYAEAFNNRGTAKYDLKNYEEAKDDFDKAVGLNPTLSQAFKNRGNTKLELKDKAGAKRDYAKAAKLDAKSKSPQIK